MMASLQSQLTHLVNSQTYGQEKGQKVVKMTGKQLPLKRSRKGGGRRGCTHRGDTSSLKRDELWSWWLLLSIGYG